MFKLCCPQAMQLTRILSAQTVGLGSHPGLTPFKICTEATNLTCKIDWRNYTNRPDIHQVPVPDSFKKLPVFPVSHPDSWPVVHLKNYAVFMSKPSTAHQSAQLKNCVEMINRPASWPQCISQLAAPSSRLPVSSGNCAVPSASDWTTNWQFPLGIVQFLVPVTPTTNY